MVLNDTGLCRTGEPNTYPYTVRCDITREIAAGNYINARKGFQQGREDAREIYYSSTRRWINSILDLWDKVELHNLHSGIFLVCQWRFTKSALNLLAHKYILSMYWFIFLFTSSQGFFFSSLSPVAPRSSIFHYFSNSMAFIRRKVECIVFLCHIFHERKNNISFLNTFFSLFLSLSPSLPRSNVFPWFYILHVSIAMSKALGRNSIRFFCTPFHKIIRFGMRFRFTH